MAVFTPVTEEQAADLMSQLGLGTLTELRGIEGGIENTNYFASTDLGDYVLTLFERLNHAQLPFYLFLMKHLAEKGIPVPNPSANRDGDILHTVCDKPAAVVNRLEGKSQLAPTASALRCRGRHAGPHAFGRRRLQPQPTQPQGPCLVE